MKNYVIGAAVLVLLAGGGYMLLSDDSTDTSSNVSQELIDSLPNVRRDFSAIIGQTMPLDNPPGFTSTTSTPFGELGDDAPQIDGVFIARVDIDEAAANTFTAATQLDVATGDYLFAVASTTRLNLGDDYRGSDELSIGLTAANADIVPIGGGEEPILTNPVSHAIFGSVSEGWHETTLFDVQDNFFPEDSPAFSFFDDDNSLVAFLFPYDVVGEDGSIVFQSFIHQTVEGTVPTLDDPTGGQGLVIERIQPTQIPSEIFSDGFESGDTSAWR